MCTRMAQKDAGFSRRLHADCISIAGGVTNAKRCVVTMSKQKAALSARSGNEMPDEI